MVQIIEMWNTLDEMVAKPFYWSSLGIETVASPSFSTITYSLPPRFKAKIRELAKLINQYGIPKGSWPQAEFVSFEKPLSNKNARKLGIKPDATRTEIFKKLLKTPKSNIKEYRDLLDIYEKYNMVYCMNLAKQHCCNCLLTPGGAIQEL